MERQDTALKLCNSCQNQILSTHRFCNICGQVQHEQHVSISSVKWHNLKQIGLFFLIEILICVCSFFIEKDVVIEFLFDAVMAIVALAFFGYNWTESKYLLKWPDFSIKKLVLFIILTILASTIVQFLVGHLNQIIFNKETSHYTLYKPYTYGKYLMILSTAIFPALFEELAYRGYLMQKLLNVLDRKEAIYLSSILFFMIHFSFISFFWLLPFAILLAYIRMKEQTIWYGVVIHFTFNLTACLWSTIAPMV